MNKTELIECVAKLPIDHLAYFVSRNADEFEPGVYEIYTAEFEKRLCNQADIDAYKNHKNTKKILSVSFDFKKS